PHWGSTWQNHRRLAPAAHRCLRCADSGRMGRPTAGCWPSATPTAAGSGGWIAPARWVVAPPRRIPAMDAARYPTLHVSHHPLVAHKLSILRDVGTDTKKFRELFQELT